MQKKQMIENVDVLVHPGFGAIQEWRALGATLGVAYGLDPDYKAVMGNRGAGVQIDAKRIRKVLFGVWGKQIQHIAKFANSGMVIVPFAFEPKHLKQVKIGMSESEKKAAQAAQVRLISFAKKLLGDRLVVMRSVDEIAHNPKEILSVYAQRGLITQDARPTFMVYGEKTNPCVSDVNSAVGKIGKSWIDNSKTERLMGSKNLAKKIIRKRAQTKAKIRARLL